MSVQTEIKVISILLNEAMEYGMELEVIHTSLKLMREDETLNPAQAFQLAMDEWIR